MSIPDFRSIMPVMLEHLADLRERSDREISRAMAEHFGLDQEERTRYLPGSDRNVFVDRVGWAKAELAMAGLIEIPKRGKAVITERGLDVLKGGNLSLKQNLFQKFLESHKKIGKVSNDPETFSVRNLEQYPQEVMEEAYEGHRRKLCAELLTRLHAGPPDFFRTLVIDLLVAMGYGGSLQDALRSIGTTGNGGLEGTVRVDRLGVENIHVQAKRVEEPLGRREIQLFLRAMQGKQVPRGIFITTSSFSQEAVWSAIGLDYSMVLLNGKDLAELMIDYDIGVTTTAVYRVKDIDTEACWDA
ncbi:MAG: restriction endonuclease [Desulfohalobiaceae bacterium]|nr:restriction endonuclease [Desulfohalobiaceae bacterium]